MRKVRPHLGPRLVEDVEAGIQSLTLTCGETGCCWTTRPGRISEVAWSRCAYA